MLVRVLQAEYPVGILQEDGQGKVEIAKTVLFYNLTKGHIVKYNCCKSTKQLFVIHKNLRNRSR
jgi:hypothetical protein